MAPKRCQHRGLQKKHRGGPCYDILSTYNIDGISAHAHDATEPVPAAQLQAQDSLLVPPGHKLRLTPLVKVELSSANEARCGDRVQGGAGATRR